MARDWWKPIPEWLTKLLPAAGILAGVFYAVLRLAYIQFYSRLGLLPEEVGLGRTEILTQAIAGPVIIGVVYSAILAAILTGAMLALRSFSLGALVRWAGLGLALAFIATFVLMYGRARSVGSSVVDEGRSVRTIFIDLSVLRIPLLDVRALPVSVEWKAGAEAPRILATNPECIFYLGETQGRVIIYNVRTRRAIRLQTADAVISTSRTPDRLPAICTKVED